MFIKLFKSTYSFQLIILFVVAILIWVHSFIQPIPATHEYTPAPLYNYLYYLLRNLPLLQVIVAFVLIITQAFLINKILIDNAIIRKNTLLPAFVYIVIMSQSHELQTLYPALFSNFLIIIVFYYLLKIYNEVEAYVEILNAGVLVGLASLFYLPAIFFIFILWIGLFIFSIFNWREWIIPIAGLLIPYLFLFMFYFWFDRLEIMFNNYIDFFVSFKEINFDLSLNQIFVLSVIFLFVLLSINRIIISLNTKTISTRKKSIIMIWFFLISLISILYAVEPSTHYLVLCFVPAACLISNYFLDIKKKFVIEGLFLLLILYIFSLSFVNYA